MFLQRTQDCDSQLTWVGQFNWNLIRIFPTFLRDAFFPGPYVARSTSQCKEGIRPTMLLAFTALAQKLLLNQRPAAVVQTDRKLVGHGALARRFTVVNLEANRAVAPKRAQSIETTALLQVARGFHIRRQAVGNKAESIEQSALARSVFSDHCNQRC